MEPERERLARLLIHTQTRANASDRANNETKFLMGRATVAVAQQHHIGAHLRQERSGRRIRAKDTDHKRVRVMFEKFRY